MTRAVRAFAPASVANIACGFDILGLALQTSEDGRATLGDVVTATRTDRTKGPRSRDPVTIAAITGDDGRLPLESERNTAAVAANALLQGEAPDIAVTLEIEKRMPLESGLGSSAASAVAAVVAVDALLGLDLPVAALLRYSLAGEILVDGSAHADNLAPSLLGGLVLVRSLEPIPDIVELPVPQGLTCAVVRPHINVNTREARSILAPHLPLPRAVAQWGNCAALIAALYRGDLELLSRSLVDVVAEPARAAAVPGFFAAKAAALAAGALGCSLSGSGPALFALCEGTECGREVADAMAAALENAEDTECDRLVSSLPAPGARVIEDDPVPAPGP
ncbi:homoserine kinase [Candidatus Palauibacter sp.]|uniref:homoserine kinase n=1 Tax=Candidatus Palauibacter sp. TaxID=3101350 RepID=UPI003CC60E92